VEPKNKQAGMDLVDLWIFKIAETLTDSIWRCVVGWEPFAKSTVGEQLVRAGDSIGANIAESFGRFSYGEKLQFLYYARGSLYETRYWLRRAYTRNLLKVESIDELAKQIRQLAVGINNFASSLKDQRSDSNAKGKLKEKSVEYQTSRSGDDLTYHNMHDPISQSLNLSISILTERELFTEEEIKCLTQLTASEF
jgi:four helix bundle protein